MGREAGLAALALEATDRVPRTEYSAHDTHWELIRRVTGIDTRVVGNRGRASAAFVEAWDYAFLWATEVGRERLGRGRITRMGHGAYAELADGTADFDTRTARPFSSLDEMLALDPCREYGGLDARALTTELERRYQERCRRFPSTLNMGGVYITLFSGLIEIYGWEGLLLALAHPSELSRVVDGYAEWVAQFFRAYAATSIPVLMCHDDLCWSSGPAASPEWYRRALFPHLRRLLAPWKEAGKKVIFTSDGDYTLFFDDLVRCGCDAFVMEPHSDMADFAARHGHAHAFVGNADTRVLLLGGRDDIRREVERCFDVGRRCPGFVMAVGNHIPPNTPVDNALWYDECYRRLAVR